MRIIGQTRPFNKRFPLDALVADGGSRKAIGRVSDLVICEFVT